MSAAVTRRKRGRIGEQLVLERRKSGSTGNSGRKRSIAAKIAAPLASRMMEAKNSPETSGRQKTSAQ
ncbi:MAG TPA: hypothetical protein VIU82_09240 [Bosea sp. (in: a-proteobacteria)]